MVKYLYLFISGILAGTCIAIGVTVYLTMVPINKVVGAALFGLGLFAVLQFNLHLYTGKIGYLIDNKPSYLIDMLFCLLGNFIGAALFAIIIKATRVGTGLSETAQILVESKQGDQWYSILFLSFMCGFMMYMAVRGHRDSPSNVGKALFVFVGIIIFILCSFEHCVANISYYTYAGVFNATSFGHLLLMILGNALGAIFFGGTLKLMNHLKDKANR